jgi:hypothetical protein
LPWLYTSKSNTTKIMNGMILIIRRIWKDQPVPFHVSSMARFEQMFPIGASVSWSVLLTRLVRFC